MFFLAFRFFRAGAVHKFCCSIYLLPTFMERQSTKQLGQSLLGTVKLFAVAVPRHSICSDTVPTCDDGGCPLRNRLQFNTLCVLVLNEGPSRRRDQRLDCTISERPRLNIEHPTIYGISSMVIVHGGRVVGERTSYRTKQR